MAIERDACNRNEPAPTDDWSRPLDGRRSLLLRAGGMLVLIATLAVVYGQSLRAPFIFDDRSSVVQNPSIRHLWPLFGSAEEPGPLRPLVDSVTAGRPLVNGSLALNYFWGRLDPVGYHVVNLLIHLLSALLLWGIVRRTLRLAYFDGRFRAVAEPLAFAAALLWAVHPLQTEAVQYVSQRTELLMGLFYLGTFYGSLRFFEADSAAARGAWLVAAIVASFCGMACKEVMVTAPVVVCLFDRAFISRSLGRALRRSWPLYLGLASSWLLLATLNYSSPRGLSAGFGTEVPAYSWWFTQSKVLVMYLGLAVWPWPLVIHYHMLYLTFAAALPWLIPVAVLVVGTLVLLWRNTALGFLGAWLLLILSPTLLVPIPSEIAAERRLYLPLAAIVVLAVVGGYELMAGFRPTVDVAATGARPRGALRWTLVVALLIASAFAWIDVRRLALYRDPVALWQDTLAHQPENGLVLVSLGAALSQAGHYEQAIGHLQQALEMQDVNASLGIHKQLGAALAGAGRNDEAVAELEVALRVDPNAGETDQLLGVVLLNMGRTDEAIDHLQRAVEQLPQDAAAREHLGVALLNAGQPLEAIRRFDEVLASGADSISTRFNLAIALARVEQPARALSEAERALALARQQNQPELARSIEAWLVDYRGRLSQPGGDAPAPQKR